MNSTGPKATTDAQAERVLGKIEEMAASNPETIVRELWEASIKRTRVCTDCGFLNYPGYPETHFSTCSTRRAQ